MAAKNHGTWTKIINGVFAQRVAHSPAEAVKFSFDGWTERVDDTKAAKAADKAADSDADTSRASGSNAATGDAKSAKSK